MYHLHPWGYPLEQGDSFPPAEYVDLTSHPWLAGLRIRAYLGPVSVTLPPSPMSARDLEHGLVLLAREVVAAGGNAATQVEMVLTMVPAGWETCITGNACRIESEPTPAKGCLRIQEGPCASIDPDQV
jgi:hypothetical protein